MQVVEPVINTSVFLQPNIYLTLYEKMNVNKENEMDERKGAFSSRGKALTVYGKELAVGDTAPRFTVSKSLLENVDSKDILKNKVTILSTVPSLDTGICDMQTRKFNEEASKLGENVQVVTISMDLPTAQARWCGAAGLDNAIVLSDYKEADFGKAFGCLVIEMRVLQRGAFVIDVDGVIQYAEYMSDISMQPNYDAVIKVAKSLL